MWTHKSGHTKNKISVYILWISWVSVAQFSARNSVYSIDLALCPDNHDASPDVTRLTTLLFCFRQPISPSIAIKPLHLNRSGFCVRSVTAGRHTLGEDHVGII